MESPTSDLGRRERQIMDVVYRLGRATVADVRRELEDPPSYSAVRGMLRLLEEKGHISHEVAGPRYVYLPTAERKQAAWQALKHVVNTFFNDSPDLAAAALVEMSKGPMSEAEYERLSKLLDETDSPGGHK
jgi:predicted transcriptional regulator